MCSVVMFLMILMFAGVAPAVVLNPDLPPSCSRSQTEKEELCICNVTLPYDKFCPSKSCTYPVLPEFHQHVKNKNCEVTWFTPNQTTLAHLHPVGLQSPATEITEEHLTTQYHVDGLWLQIILHDENAKRHQFKTVYRATDHSNSSSFNSGQTMNQTRSHITVLVVCALALCVIVGGLIIWKCTPVCRNKDTEVDRRTGSDTT